MRNLTNPSLSLLFSKMIKEEILGNYRGHARIRRLIHFAQHSTKSEAQTVVNEAATICLESDSFL